MSNVQTYAGSCHCGKVRFEATTELSKVISCNCSMCARSGYLLTFVAEDKFKLLSGEGELSDYQFHKRVIHHVFCRNCGVRSFARGAGPDGKTTYAVNVRCLEGVDVDALAITKVDGRSL